MKSAAFTMRSARLATRPMRHYAPRATRCATTRRRLCATCVPEAKRLRSPVICATHASAGAATSAEELANRKRWEESGNAQGSIDDWKWTLNWNEIFDNIVIGSCPRSTGDVDRIVNESGATAILSVQSDLCLEALNIDYAALREHGLSRGIMMTRVPIRDFDHGDQTLMLPEAVRTLALLTALNYKVYVHCTAGINRATLTVLGYMTFVQGWDLYSALKKIKSARSQANPYIDCWKNVKTRLLEGRSEEVIALSRKFFLKNENGSKEDSFSNWVAAEDLVIKETFRRLLANSVNTITDLIDLRAEAVCGVCVSPDEIERANKEIENLQYELMLQRERLAEATASLNAQNMDQVRPENAQKWMVNGPYETVNGLNGDAPTFLELDGHPIDTPGTPLMVYDELLRVKKEVSALKKCIRKIAMVSTEALSIDCGDSYTDWEEDPKEQDADVLDLELEDDEPEL